MSAFYSDNDRFCAAWLRNLAAAGHIPAGGVDETDIRELDPAKLRGYGQVHLFAGVGGWPLALRLAGWPEDCPVWTGSCPCQPYSCAGRRKGNADDRNLWPAFRRLVAECRPATIFGEQVASNDGREWIAGVRADLEDLGYAVGAADLCAAGVAAPHIRQRLYWVAVAAGERRRGRGDGDSAGVRRKIQVEGRGCARGLLDADNARLEGRSERPVEHAGKCAPRPPNPWSDFVLLPFRDGKTRRIEPGLEPLAHGVSGRVGRLRAYGNAIVPHLAAEFIRAADEAIMGARP